MYEQSYALKVQCCVLLTLLLFLTNTTFTNSRDAKPYSACIKYQHPDPASDDPLKRQQTVCSDYLKSRNDTHFQAPLKYVYQTYDKAWDEYYTEVDPNIQALVEAAVIAAVRTIKEFPFLELQCQNSILGALCSAYLPICDSEINPLLERGCPNNCLLIFS